jgi:tRNA A-37 threonylcarbamoyl transferase component Bud32
VLSPGVVLDNRYLLNERVATGGMGHVWSATDTVLKRKVAVKVLLPSLVSDTEFITRFRTEARLMAALRHPGIVQVYDYGEDAVADGRRVDYLVMEYIEGVPLSKRLEATGKLRIADTVSVVVQAAQALHVAHSARIVHRDVKPSNLLVQPDGAVVLVDFGVARSANVTSITGTNIVLGTTHYMAPEQIAGRPVSAATDIYALGAVAYYCLTGRPPFVGVNPLQVATQHLQDEPPALPAEIPASVAALVIRALAKDPADRYPSAAAFADAARAAHSTAPTPQRTGTGETTVKLVPDSLAGPQPVAAPPTGRNRGRRALLAGGAGAAGIALIGLVALVTLRPWEGRPPADSLTEARAGASAGADPGADTIEPGPDATATAAANRSATASPGPIPSASAGPTTTGNPKPTAKPTKASPKNPYTPAQVCGDGYRLIDSAALTGSDGTLRGNVYLLYNAGNGYNCAVALKTTSVGTASTVSTYLEVQGRARATNSGSFSYYAGPVRGQAAGQCVKWGGSASGVSYASPFEHCD